MHDFNKTKEEIINRYDDRFKEHGIDPLSLNWLDLKSQNKRFENILNLININNKKIIDIGCGFADLLKYIQENKINFKEYTGTDINPNFINQCKKLYPERNFFINNLFNEDLPKDNCDIAIMVGMLSYKFKSFDNNHFIKEVINKAFSSVKETLIFDMQSSITNPDYPTAEHIHYQNPGEILDFALSLTPYVSIKHDYMPNPAREFLIILNHKSR
jgi:SAM-dependent methyltransferase